METVTIPRRFNGPPDSANGGYACGVVAGLLHHDDRQAEVEPGRGQIVDVMLRLPPPLETPLRVEREDDRVTVHDGDDFVAEAGPIDLDLDLPSVVTLEEASSALAAVDVDAELGDHAFPTCFTCGPAREPGDGLRIFAFPVPGRDDDLVAAPWVPHESLAGEDGAVPEEVVWAALDCPTYFAWHTMRATALLGRLGAQVRRVPEVGEELAVAAWRITQEGRKLLSGSAIFDARGDVVAAARATWITVD